MVPASARRAHQEPDASAALAARPALKNLGVTREKLLDALRKVRGNRRVTDQDPEAVTHALLSHLARHQ